MDRYGIAPGNVWPDRLKRAVETATVGIALIGPGWLTTADEYGRRRLDDSKDWVRRELVGLIERRIPILPLLLGDKAKVPPSIALPSALRSLSSMQAYSLREDHWETDIQELVRHLVADHQCKEIEKKVRLPEPRVKVNALTAEELDSELGNLQGWEPVETLVPGDYPKTRKELRKAYVFDSFPAAMKFMAAGVEDIRKKKHHPRWENQWRTVTVFLSTWDVGFQITSLDVDLAKILDSIYEQQGRLDS